MQLASQISLQQISGIIPSTGTRYMHHGSNILMTTLCAMPEARIEWPAASEIPNMARRVRKKYPLIQSCIGFADGVHLPIEVDGTADILNAYYNGWTTVHYTSNVFAFATDGTLNFATVNALGSWSDSVVAYELYWRLEERTSEPFCIVTDTAFPTANRLATKIKQPLKADFNGWPADPDK